MTNQKLNIEFIEAKRTSKHVVEVTYKLNNIAFIVGWCNLEEGHFNKVGNYDLYPDAKSLNPALEERVNNAIKEGECSENPDEDLYLFIRDTFSMWDCEDFQPWPNNHNRLRKALISLRREMGCYAIEILDWDGELYEFNLYNDDGNYYIGDNSGVSIITESQYNDIFDHCSIIEETRTGELKGISIEDFKEKYLKDDEDD